MAIDDTTAFLSGMRLYGDDFSDQQIAEWFSAERDAYYQLAVENLEYTYRYHAINQWHGFRFLPKKPFSHALGIGSAFGDELLPIVHKLDRITIAEPSEHLRSPSLGGKPVEYVTPSPSGLLPLPSSEFDLVTCLGVLHHIPNVSKVVQEIARCMQPRGYLLLREPIASLGDWRFPRQGLTKKERGIPVDIMRQIITRSGLEVVRERKCFFSAIVKAGRLVTGKDPYNSIAITALDDIIANLPFWSAVYHPRTLWERFRAWSAFWILRKK